MSQRAAHICEKMFFIVVRKFFIKVPQRAVYICEKIFFIKVSQRAAIEYIFSLAPIDIMYMYLFPFLVFTVKNKKKWVLIFFRHGRGRRKVSQRAPKHTTHFMFRESSECISDSETKKTVLSSLYYLTQPQKCIHMAKYFPA